MRLPQCILDLFDESYELVYVDWNSSFDDPEAIQTAINKKDYYPLDECINDWYFDSEVEGLWYHTDDFATKLCSVFDISKERAKKFVEKYRELIEEEIINRESNTVFDDMLRHTTDPVCYIDLGLDADDIYYLSLQEQKQLVKEIKRALHIPIRCTTLDQKIYDLLINAQYGQLVVYFTADIKDFVEHTDKWITFKNPHIAIVDHLNGSGSDVQLVGHSFTIKYDSNEVTVDKTVHYNYTYSVCGMSDTWCNDTIVKFSKTKKGN